MSSGLFKNVTYKLFVYKLYTFNIYVQTSLTLTYKDWCAIKPNPTNLDQEQNDRMVLFH